MAPERGTLKAKIAPATRFWLDRTAALQHEEEERDPNGFRMKGPIVQPKQALNTNYKTEAMLAGRSLLFITVLTIPHWGSGPSL
jgi:hypothetical protein